MGFACEIRSSEMCLTKVLLRFCTEEPFDFNHPEGIPQLAAGKLHLQSSPLRRRFYIFVAKSQKTVMIKMREYYHPALLPESRSVSHEIPNCQRPIPGRHEKRSEGA
jgi:hypothetical protein